MDLNNKKDYNNIFEEKYKNAIDESDNLKINYEKSENIRKDQKKLIMSLKDEILILKKNDKLGSRY